MAGWTLVDTHPTQGRTFQRPLDALELFFFWNGLVDGTGDSSHYYQLRLSNGLRDAHLFSEANIVEAWLSTKRRLPLAGAIVRGADMTPLHVAAASSSELYFVVQEHNLGVLRPGEIVFESASCAEEAQHRAAAILHESRSLSEEMMVQLYVLHETASKKTDVLHMIVLMSHCVADGIATRTFMRCLLDTLARGGVGVPAQIPLEERLAMANPPEDLQPADVGLLSPARRRWRKVIGIVICQLRAKKLQGGHALPCRFTRSPVATRSGHVFTSLTSTQTATVIANCRLHNLTFGNAYLVLAQVAMTRVLYRRYLRGEMSQDEWEYRKRQPHITRGPFNMRRYLDRAWFDNGGEGGFTMSISIYTYVLPFMTLGASAERRQIVLSDGAPPFPDLLTFDRFLHRARLVTAQAKAYFSHPLLLEIIHAAHSMAVPFTQHLALQWMQRAGTTNGHDAGDKSDENKVLGVTEMPTVIAHGGSSLGNVDLILPSEYPLPPTHPLSPYSPMPRPLAKAGYVTAPSPLLSNFEAKTISKILVEDSRTHLHMLAGQPYLGAATLRGKMSMFVHYDRNALEEEVVKEWLDEVKGAVLWYLGRTQ